MTDTPRTDAEWTVPLYGGGAAVAVDFACTLERELNAAKAQIERLRAVLEYAVSQTEHDMLLTGEECRAARAALKETK